MCVRRLPFALRSTHPVGALPEGALALASTGCAALSGGMRPSLNDCHVCEHAQDRDDGRDRTANTNNKSNSSINTGTLVATWLSTR